MADLLDADSVRSAVAVLDGWEGGPDAIVRTVGLRSFPAAIAVVDRVAKVAEEMDHHPDIDIRWRTLTFRCVTHSAGGVTTRDDPVTPFCDSPTSGLALAGLLRYCLVMLAGIGEGSGRHAPRRKTVVSGLSPGMRGLAPVPSHPVPG